MKRAIKKLLAVLLLSGLVVCFNTMRLNRSFIKARRLNYNLYYHNENLSRLDGFNIIVAPALRNALNYRVKNYDLAQSTAFVYFLENNENLVSDEDYRSYMEIFENTVPDDCLQAVSQRYGYEIDQEHRRQIMALARQWNFVDLSNLLNGWNDQRIGYYRGENYVIHEDDPEYELLWKMSFDMGGGNVFYYWGSLPGGWDDHQCTTYCWSRFYMVYGYDSGARGDGKYNAAQVVNRHPMQFYLSSTPKAGAVFSLQGREGHTGFVEAFDGTNIWITDGNYDGKGTIRINYRYSWSGFKKYGGKNMIFAVPYSQ